MRSLARARGAERGTPDQGVTVTEAIMPSASSWKRQWYTNVPAFVNVSWNEPPGGTAPEFTSAVPS